MFVLNDVFTCYALLGQYCDKSLEIFRYGNPDTNHSTVCTKALGKYTKKNQKSVICLYF